MNKLTLLLFVIIGLINVSCSNPQENILRDAIYQCPMKCEGEKTYNETGQCPVCKMNTERIEKTNANTTESLQENKAGVIIAGAMRNVMHKGELIGTISLDTIADKIHLYGIGPAEYLNGEILIMDGKSYKSTVASAGTMKMEETFSVKAPFFVYANIENWNEIILPDSIQTLAQLESYLDNTTTNYRRPFAFKVSAVVDNADIHVVNLPEGTKVSSPEDAHKNQATYTLNNEPTEMVGFFSTEHQGVFTHHDSFMHIHLITKDKTKMGHLDMAVFKNGTAKLFLPK